MDERRVNFQISVTGLVNFVFKNSKLVVSLRHRREAQNNPLNIHQTCLPVWTLSQERGRRRNKGSENGAAEKKRTKWGRASDGRGTEVYVFCLEAQRGILASERKNRACGRQNSIVGQDLVMRMGPGLRERFKAE